MAKSQPLCTNVLKADGWIVGRTEFFNTYAKESRDLFGCLDAVGFKGKHTGLFQFCKEDYQDHITKLKGLEVVPIILEAEPIILIGVKKMLIKTDGKAKRYYFRVGYFHIVDGKVEYTELQTWRERIPSLEVVYEFLEK